MLVDDAYFEHMITAFLLENFLVYDFPAMKHGYSILVTGYVPGTVGYFNISFPVPYTGTTGIVPVYVQHSFPETESSRMMDNFLLAEILSHNLNSRITIA